jgi:hypothetical protein
MEVHGVQSTLKNSNNNNNNSMDDTTNNSIAGSNSILSNNTNGIDDKGTPTNESIWVERISLYENKMVEAQDNERMMRHELIEANKALEKAVETNTNTIQKYTSSKKLIGELKMALKLSKEESRLLENERKRLTIENVELNNAIEKMDRVVYGNSGGSFTNNSTLYGIKENIISKHEDDDTLDVNNMDVDALKLVQSMTNVVDDTLNSTYAKKYNKKLSMYKSKLGVSNSLNHTNSNNNNNNKNNTSSSSSRMSSSKSRKLKMKRSKGGSKSSRNSNKLIR